MNNSLRCSQTGPISDKILLEYRQFANTPPDERTAKNGGEWEVGGCSLWKACSPSLPPCWKTITKDSSLASIVSSSNMAATSLPFDSLGIDCKPSA